MNEKEDWQQQLQQQQQQMEEENFQPLPACVPSATIGEDDSESEQPNQEEDKARLAAAAAVVLDSEQPPEKYSMDKRELDEQNSKIERTSPEEEVEEASSPMPPPLVRTQARQLSRVGAVAIAGINAPVTPPPNREESTTIEGDEENPPMTTLEANVSSSSVFSYATEATIPMPNVTARLVSGAEYEAELQRVIMRTAVRASKVETEEEETVSTKWTLRFFASLFCGLLVLTVIITTAALTASPNMFGLSDDPDGPDRTPQQTDDNVVFNYEDALREFLKSRSFDGGESLELYASPQRTALRYIALEFPEMPLDEKVIDLYVISVFFFAAGGTFWTNNTKWKSGDSVCIWHGVGCDESGHVVSISLSNNYLRGNLPPELGLLAPRQVGNTTTLGLTTLDLSYNQIKGQIPDQVSFLTSMKEFKVDGNELSGNIPSGITSWTALKSASFTDNGLHGGIPNAFCKKTEIEMIISVDCAKVRCSCCTPSCSAAAWKGTDSEDQEEFVSATTLSPPTKFSPQEIGTTSASEEVPQEDVRSDDSAGEPSPKDD